MRWNRLEHQVWSQLKAHQILGKTLILAVSGGLDSMALLSVFKRLNLKSKVIVAHFHHGSSEHEETSKFRDQALKLVTEKAPQLDFVSSMTERALNSEAEFRAARTLFINQILKTHKEAIVVTAHHQNDHLETLFLKMLRGSGREGLKSFKEFNGKIFRPFLQNQKSDLKSYAAQLRLDWLEDPSNTDERFLRNWLRQNWFPALENRQKGALHNLAQSLNHVLTATPDDHFFRWTDRKNLPWIIVSEHSDQLVLEIDRDWFRKLGRSSRENVVFYALKQAQQLYFKKNSQNPVSNQEKKSPFWDLTTGRVKEILKRLDKNQKDIKFTIGPLKALTSVKKIMLQFTV